ncbi:MAG TPA: phosphoadenylyl-sulfate reductase [Lentisphaeria bacterium]|nr:MAG: phosphoadenosine phosphosulfate reductase [Lentisphaerae bacterium GWF2_38_69]HBM16493.1 phosphoadenylyl-sulfate reductase [Lentisphaeria bacterium]
MNRDEIRQLNKEFESVSADEILHWALKYFGVNNIALASSFSIEDQLILDMLLKVDKKAQIFTLDTGRLPQATYDLIEITRKKYAISIEMFFPDASAVEAMTKKKGPNSFFESVENRKECCAIRKIEPLKKKLSTLKAWITGLRREQSEARSDVPFIEWDEAFGLVKINPIADWEELDIWDYIRNNRVPYNRLYDCSYTSIGCAPCTRPVKKGESTRAGRWWWENEEKKECGIHIKDGKVVRKE